MMKTYIATVEIGNDGFFAEVSDLGGDNVKELTTRDAWNQIQHAIAGSDIVVTLFVNDSAVMEDQIITAPMLL